MTEDENSFDLEHCPFCGSEAELYIETDHHGEFFNLGCSVDDCIGHWAFYTQSTKEISVEEGVNIWNTRAIDEMLLEGLERCLTTEDSYPMCVLGRDPRSIDVIRFKEINEIVNIMLSVYKNKVKKK